MLRTLQQIIRVSFKDALTDGKLAEIIVFSAERTSLKEINVSFNVTY